MADSPEPLKAMETRLADLITNVKESLEAELESKTESLRHDIKDLGVRFDNQAARMERHAALLQTGNRWIARLNDWSAKVDAALEVKDKQIAELNERLRKLERKQ